jgi:hypothetical protein
LRELDRIWFAESTGLIYSRAADRPLTGEWWIDDNLTEVHVGLDPGQSDEFGFAIGQFVPDPPEPERSFRWLDSYGNQYKVGEFYAHILTGLPPRRGDPAWGERFTSRDEEMMAWFAQIPWRLLKVYMDPAGSQIDSSKSSFLSRIIKESRRLRRRWLEEEAARRPDKAEALPALREIRPDYRELLGKARFQTRHSSLNKLLTISEFARTPGALKLQSAMAEYGYAERGPRATSDPKPLHTDDSHIVTAGEFMASHLDLRGLIDRAAAFLVKEAA